MTGEPAEAERLCLDATIVIHFEDAGKMSVLEAVCVPDGKVPRVVVEEEWRGHAVTGAAQVEGYPWLAVVTADDPADLQVIADLSRRYPSPPDKDRGEVEMVALAHRYGWIAICEDEGGRTQADDYNVDRIYIVTLLAAAVEFKLISHKDAWAAHKAVEQSRGYRSILRGDDDHRAVFADVVRAFHGLRNKQGDPSFHDFLRTPGLDGIVVAVRRRHASS